MQTRAFTFNHVDMYGCRYSSVYTYTCMFIYRIPIIYIYIYTYMHIYIYMNIYAQSIHIQKVDGWVGPQDGKRVAQRTVALGHSQPPKRRMPSPARWASPGSTNRAGQYRGPGVHIHRRIPHSKF